MRIIDSLDTAITNPTIFLGSFEWREPITTLTDVMVSLVCVFAVIQFYRYKGNRPEYFKYYRAYFICFSVGMMASAWFGHGLKAYTDPDWKTVGWVMSAVSHLFLGIGTLKQIQPVTKPSIHTAVKVFYFLQFSVFVFLLLNPGTRNFIYAQLCSVISLVGLVLPMHIFNYSKTKQRGSIIVILAIACGVLPAISFNLQITAGKWFNYHDLSHVLMAGIMFVMYLGVSRLSLVDKYTEIKKI